MSSSARRRPSTRLIVLVAVVAVVLVGGGVGAWAAFGRTGAGEAQAAPTSAPSSPTPSVARTVAPVTALADGPGALPDGLAMGVVELRVNDFPGVLAYYRDAVGLTVLEESGKHAVLGFDSPLIRLYSGSSPAGVREAGLYHSAVLFADAPTLARALLSIAETAPETFQGATDHIVSEAFYFTDPEGNGLELYVDRPRESWEWKDGRVTMGGEPIDVNAFIQEHAAAAAAAAGPVNLGHVHLEVGDLALARAFYEGVLGFDVTAEVPGAIFYSAGGYHHHLATNTWQTEGAGVRTGTAGLGAFTMTLPTVADIDAAAARLGAAGAEYERTEAGIDTVDPWGNRVRLRTA
jgi:catechol 2,3-dioxygenase